MTTPKPSSVATRPNQAQEQSEALDPARAEHLSGLFFERVGLTPEAIAYWQFDPASHQWQHTTWADMAFEVGCIQAAMQRDGLQKGERIALMLKNSREWVLFDQAALGLGLVVVPLYTDDRPENVVHILKQTNARMLVVDGRRQWRGLQQAGEPLAALKRIVTLQSVGDEDGSSGGNLAAMSDWLFGAKGAPIRYQGNADDLATIVYTSGTAGRAKGVMLSHANILENAAACSQIARINHQDRFLSFLPLSHTLERTAGYYLPMLCGAEVAFARNVQTLAEDLQIMQPTLLISVPRIYEKVFERLQRQIETRGRLAKTLFEQTVVVGWYRYLCQQQRPPKEKPLWPMGLLWPLLDAKVAAKLRARLGGRLRFAICGGAPLSPRLAKVFTAMGVPVLQGYGLTEAAPVVSVNPPEDNRVETIGKPLENVQVRLGEQNELLVQGPGVMLGYWQNESATQDAIDDQGWLHTGDQAYIEESGHLRITGRLKDIIVLANGEKVPPADMETAIALDPLIDQIMIVGEGHHQLVALVVVNPDTFAEFVRDYDFDPSDPQTLEDRFVEKLILKRINKRLVDFPGYAQIRRVGLIDSPWSIESGLLTPTQKLKRPLIEREYQSLIEQLLAK